jgi:hypothetical protein
MKVRPEILAHEQRLKIGQSDIIWPSIGADLSPMAELGPVHVNAMMSPIATSVYKQVTEKVEFIGRSRRPRPARTYIQGIQTSGTQTPGDQGFCAQASCAMCSANSAGA